MSVNKQNKTQSGISIPAHIFFVECASYTAHLESEPSRSTLRSMPHTHSSLSHRIHEDPARFSSPRSSLPSWFPTSHHLPILYFLLLLWRNVQGVASDQLLQLFILTLNFDFKVLLVSKSEIRFRGCNRIAHIDHHGISSWLVWKKSSPRVWGRSHELFEHDRVWAGC